MACLWPRKFLNSVSLELIIRQMNAFQIDMGRYKCSYRHRQTCEAMDGVQKDIENSAKEYRKRIYPPCVVCMQIGKFRRNDLCRHSEKAAKFES